MALDVLNLECARQWVVRVHMLSVAVRCRDAALGAISLQRAAKKGVIVNRLCFCCLAYCPSSFKLWDMRALTCRIVL